MKEQFKIKVMQSVDKILEDIGGNMLFMVIKPVVNLAKPELEKTIEEKPENVYNWLVMAREKISEAITAYENEQ
jgi:hypothetical protein